MAQKALTLPDTTIGKKAIMAVSSIMLMLFIVAHLAGNLLIFSGREAMNDYANFLRDVGHGAPIWVLRAMVIVAVLGHIWGAVALNARNRAARPVGYRRKQSLESTIASRTMFFGGIALLLYIVYHLAHFTFHYGVPGGMVALPVGQYEHIEYDVYQMAIASFQNPVISGIYILAQLALGLHLYHGAWSFMQTLGWNHRRYNEGRRLFAAAFAGLVSVGFIIIPVAVLAGIVK
ncbi:MAG: succinate dehydrogenase cytochrome b subunit [Myxococcales bacterium]|nr:succinate dehydrogenase cytochrome b subunit [Myxococcales bacterium]MCB9551486.1 succinate dehydrogenase cytochrome b subunit [Myxococcales bacterium]